MAETISIIAPQNSSERLACKIDKPAFLICKGGMATVVSLSFLVVRSYRGRQELLERSQLIFKIPITHFL